MHVLHADGEVEGTGDGVGQGKAGPLVYRYGMATLAPHAPHTATSVVTADTGGRNWGCSV